jgi:hypothetical protein
MTFQISRQESRDERMISRFFLLSDLMVVVYFTKQIYLFEQAERSKHSCGMKGVMG